MQGRLQLNKYEILGQLYWAGAALLCGATLPSPWGTI